MNATLSKPSVRDAHPGIIPFCAAILAGVALLARVPLLASPRAGKLQFVEYSFVFFASIAISTTYTRFRDRLRIRRVLEPRGNIFLFALLLAVSVYKLAMFQFGGFDEGYIASAAKHYADGLKPYVDFPSVMPPMFLAGIRISMIVFGLRWASFAILSSVFSAITSLWLYGLLRMLLPRHWAFAMTAVSEISTMILAPFWWYNNSTSVSVLLLLASVFVCIYKPGPVFPWVSLTLSLGMLLAAKPNAAIMCLSVLVLFISRTGIERLRVIFACFFAAVLALSICYIAQTPPLQLAHAYHEVASLRGSPFLLYPFRIPINLIESLAQGALAILVLVGSLELLVKHTIRQDRRWSVLAVVSVAIITGVEMTMTNAESKPVDLIVLLAAMTLLSIEPANDKGIAPESRPILAALMSVFLVWSLFFGATHLRILGIGEGSFFQHAPTRKIQTGFFAGLEAGPRLLSIQEQIGRAMKRYPAKKVFFGPRLECEYAAFNRPSIPVLPVQWDPGNQYSPTLAPTLLREFKEQDPDLLIILKHDYYGLENISDYIQHSPLYQIDDNYDDLTLYVRK